MSKRPKELDDRDRQSTPAADDDIASEQPYAEEYIKPLPPPQFDGMASHKGRAIAAAKLHDMETLIASMPGRERFSFCVGWILGATLTAIGFVAFR